LSASSWRLDKLKLGGTNNLRRGLDILVRQRSRLLLEVEVIWNSTYIGAPPVVAVVIYFVEISASWMSGIDERSKSRKMNERKQSGE
jgi:hypothetical protein